jgi:hypothetical protein
MRAVNEDARGEEDTTRKAMQLMIEIKPGTIKRTLFAAVALAALGTSVVAYAGLPHTWNEGDTLTAADLNANFSKLDLNKASLFKPKPFFSWSHVDVPASDVTASPPEGMQTITFTDPGYYRITLNVHSVHDGTAVVEWNLSGTVTRLDPFTLEVGKKISILSSETRLVESTVIFVSASAGQTLTVTPALTVTYAVGNYHGANFMYGVEYLGAS